jgi:hypothetical protein
MATAALLFAGVVEPKLADYVGDRIGEIAGLRR